MRKLYGYICARCRKRGNDGTYLAAHHLQNFAKFPDLRHNIENGVTLCEVCHLDFHKTYGFSKNTKEQFEEHKMQKASMKQLNRNKEESSSQEEERNSETFS